MLDYVLKLRKLLQTKSFEDHAGRPGQVGGSMPKGEAEEVLVKTSVLNRWGSSVDCELPPKIAKMVQFSTAKRAMENVWYSDLPKEEKLRWYEVLRKADGHANV